MAFSVNPKDNPFLKSRDSIASRQPEEPGYLKQAAGGLLVGIHEDPIAGFFINQVVDLLPGVDRQDISDLQRNLRGKTLAQVAEFIGEWGTTIGLGVGAYGLGRAAGRALLSRYAPGLAAKGAEHLLGRQAIQFLERGKAATAGFEGAAKLLRMGGLERAAEAAGGALASGAQMGLGTGLDGGSPADIAESFLIGAVLSGGTEAGIYGFSRTFSPRFKSGAFIDKAGKIARYEDMIKARSSAIRQPWNLRLKPSGRSKDIKIPNIQQTNLPFQTTAVTPVLEGEGPQIAKLQEKLNILLRIDKYEEALSDRAKILTDRAASRSVSTSELARTKSEIAELGLGRQIEMFPESTLSPKPTNAGEQLGFEKAAGPQYRQTRSQFYGDTQPKPKITYIPGTLSKKRQIIAKNIAQKRAELGVLRSKLYARKELLANASDEALYNSQIPYDRSTQYGSLRGWLSQFIESPHSLAQRMGITGGRALKVIEQNEIKSQIAKEDLTIRLFNDFDTIAAHLNKPRATAKQILNGKFLEHYDTHLKEFFRYIEVHGPEKATQKFGSEPVSKVMSLLKDYEDIYTPLVKLGAQPLQTAKDLAARGVKVHMPHVGKRGVKNEDAVFLQRVRAIISEQSKKGKFISELEAEAQAAAELYDETYAAINKFGSIDQSRDFSGDLITQSAHFDMEGYATGLFRYGTEVHRRAAYSNFGLNGEYANEILALARREGADVATLAKYLNQFVGSKHYYHPAMVAWSRRIINLQAASKLTLATIPNIFQVLVNNVPTIGIKNTLRGMASTGSYGYTGLKTIPGLKTIFGAIDDAGEQLVVRAVALHEQYLAAARHAHVADPILDTTISDRIANFTLKSTLFELTERMNRLATGFGSLLQIRELTLKGINNRLKGRNLDFARRQFRSVNLDLDKIISYARKNSGKTIDEAINATHGAGALDRAVFSLTRDMQFTPIQTRLPLMWQTPAGRILTQFKSFAFNQGILVRDSILAEAAQGNMKPLATATALYPITGLAAHETIGLFKRRKKDPTELGKFLSIASSVGGFGLTSSMILSAYYGRLSDFLAGPTGTDAGSFSQAAILDIMDGSIDHTLKRIQSQPIYIATSALTSGAGVTIEKGLDLIDNIGDSKHDIGYTTYEQLIQDRKR